MAFTLKLGRGVGSEVRRLLDSQLTAAIEKLGGTAPDVESGRRHIKKARALLLLAEPALDRRQRAVARRLKKASHLLGPLTDSQTVVTTLDGLIGYDLRRLPPARIEMLRAAFLEDARQTKSGHLSAWLCARVIRILRKERAQLAGARFASCGVRTTAATVRAAHRRARAARRAAATHAGSEVFHAWRRRTKAEWHLFRLIDDAVRGRLLDDQRRLEQLDGCLGALHDIAVLQDHVRARSPLSRAETAAALVAMRGYARDLRRRAWVLSDAQDEPPRDLETRVIALWLSGAAPTVAVREVEPWRRPA